MNKSFKHHGLGRGNSAGFTLVELLVVMAIVAILTSLSVTAFRSVNSALGLSTAGQTITSEITTARQTALTYSEIVEVRFYYYTDPITNTQQYNAVQTFGSTDGSNFVQIDRITYLPPSILISSSSNYSFPLGSSDTTFSPAITPVAATGAVPIPAVGMTYTYKALRFKPGGGVDYVVTGASPGAMPTGVTWPPTSWYITLFEKKYVTTTVPSPAASSIKNFITINVDSADGRIRTFQP